MKTIKVIIVILLVIICAQFYLLIRQTKLERYIRYNIQMQESTPIEVYVSGMTKAVEKAGQDNIKLLIQAKWAMRHLENCIELMESERGLEPIAIDRGKMFPSYSGMGLPPLPPKKEQNKHPFVSPYKEPQPKKQDDPKESDIRKLMCLFNLQRTAIAFSMYSFDAQIENYQQRLMRLDPNAQ